MGSSKSNEQLIFDIGAPRTVSADGDMGLAILAVKTGRKVL
jgi:hypothetical protein